MIRVSSMVTALLFVRVVGDVREGAVIESFTAERRLVERPPVAFALRVRNTGNVHVRPVGEVVISDMWGRERGRVPLNQADGFGYVLPASARTFAVDWQSDTSLLDTGRYQATAVVAVGDRAQQQATASFWIVPIKPLLGIVAGAMGIAAVLLWSIRRYVRKSLARLLRQGVDKFH
jgi:hypothetical protein